MQEGQYESEVGGPFMTIVMHIAGDDGTDWLMGGTTVAKPEAELERPPPALGANRQAEDDGVVTAVPSWFLPFYRRHFGRAQGGAVAAVMEAAARHGKITPNALYEFASSRVVAGRLVLIGDAAHMASPRTAVGGEWRRRYVRITLAASKSESPLLSRDPCAAHTAVLDALGLLEAFSDAARDGKPGGAALIDRALTAYDGPGLARAAELLARSREVSAPVAVQGWPYKEPEGGGDSEGAAAREL